MFKYVLVPATGAAGDEAVFETALLAAHPSDAHLHFLHTRVDVAEVIVGMSAGGEASGMLQSTIDQLDEEGRVREQKARDDVAAFCGRAGIALGGEVGLSAEFTAETGNDALWLAERGRFADLVVAGRKREGGGVRMDILEAALMDTGRPVLIAPLPIAPARPPQGLAGTVAIAWKDTAEAARAVAAAMPMIGRAERVVLLSAREGDDADDDSGERMQRALRWHNPTTTLLRLEDDGREPVEILLEAARGQDASLLVMGGYSRSRLREAVFGGVTHSVLRSAELPVLMAH